MIISDKLVGFVSMVGVVVGLVLGGVTLEYSWLIAALFFLLAVASFIIFATFLYHFYRYAEYEMPVENVKDDIIPDDNLTDEK
jgi:hypothetical protein